MNATHDWASPSYTRSVAAPRRFHQSDAKVLLTESPAHLKHRMEHGGTSTRAMQGGSLLDYLVFGLDTKYEVVDARYKSGKREGEVCDDWTATEAKLARKEVEKLGKLAVLECEVDELDDIVGRIKQRLRDLSEGDEMLIQPVIQWTSALGVECEGTPDVVFLRMSDWRVRVVDLKRTASVHPSFVQRQIKAMCWQMQAAAYREATLAVERKFSAKAYYGGHTMLVAEAAGIGMVRAYPLDQVYMEIGQRLWEKAQTQWNRCVAEDSWPGYAENPIGPSLYETRTELETYDFPEEP